MWICEAFWWNFPISCFHLLKESSSFVLNKLTWKWHQSFSRNKYFRWCLGLIFSATVDFISVRTNTFPGRSLAPVWARNNILQPRDEHELWLLLIQSNWLIDWLDCVCGRHKTWSWSVDSDLTAVGAGSLKKQPISPEDWGEGLTFVYLTDFWTWNLWATKRLHFHKSSQSEHIALIQ